MATEAQGSAPVFTVTVEGGGSFTCKGGDRLLIAMERRGASAIPVGCRGGGCGACKVRITKGRYSVGVMSRRHVSEEEQANGVALACRVFPESDLSLRVIAPVRRSE